MGKSTFGERTLEWHLCEHIVQYVKYVSLISNSVKVVGLKVFFFFNFYRWNSKIEFFFNQLSSPDVEGPLVDVKVLE